MGKLLVADRELVDPDLYDLIVASVQMQTPIQALLKRGRTPTDYTQLNEVEGMPVTHNPALTEGYDFDKTAAKRTNLKLASACEIFGSDGWQVSNEREKLPSHTEKKGENAVARAKRKDQQNLILSIENVFGSEQEANEAASDSEKWLTRGMAKWLNQATPSTVEAIPTELLPLAPITGNMTTAGTLTEDIFRNKLLEAVVAMKDGNVMLTGLCGIKLKALMSTWLGKATTVTGTENLVQSLRNMTDKKLGYMVDFFQYDGVNVRTLTCNHLLADTANFAATDASWYSGAFIRPEMWSIDWLETVKPMNAGEDKGGGKRGWYRGIGRLCCRNPMAQFMIKHVSA